MAKKDSKTDEKKSAGRPRRYRTATELDKRCQEYIRLCEEQDAFPDEAGMLGFLGISDTTRDRYIANEDDKYPHYGDAFARARRARESWLSRRAFKDPKAAQITQFLLKQEKNGGYTDKQSNDASAINVNVRLEGTGKSDAFG